MGRRSRCLVVLGMLALVIWLEIGVISAYNNNTNNSSHNNNTNNSSLSGPSPVATNRTKRDIPAATNRTKRGIPAATIRTQHDIPAATNRTQHDIPAATNRTQHGIPAATNMTQHGIPAATNMTQHGIPAATNRTQDDIPAATSRTQHGIPTATNRTKRAITVNDPRNMIDSGKRFYIKRKSSADHSFTFALVNRLKGTKPITDVICGALIFTTSTPSSTLYFEVQNDKNTKNFGFAKTTSSAKVEIFAGTTTPASGKAAEYEMHVLNMTMMGLGMLSEDRRPERTKYYTPAVTTAANTYGDSAYDEGGFSPSTPYDISSFFHTNKFGFYQNKSGTDVKYKPNHPLLQHESKDNLGPEARLGRIGPKEYLSFRDRKAFNLLAKCTSIYCKTPPSCKYSGFVDRTCKCKCPPGISGSTCNAINSGSLKPSFCYDIATADTSAPDSKIIVPMHYPDPYEKEERCYWIIKNSNVDEKVMFNLEWSEYLCEEAELTVYLYGPEVIVHPLSCKKEYTDKFVDKWFSSQTDVIAVSWKTTNKTLKGKYNGFRLRYAKGCSDKDGKVGFCLPDTSKWNATQKIPCYSCNSDVDDNCRMSSSQNPLGYDECDAGSSCYTKVTKTNGKTRTVKSCTKPSETCKNNDDDCRNGNTCTICCQTPLCNTHGAEKRTDDEFLAVKSKINLPPPPPTTPGATEPPGGAAGTILTPISMIVSALTVTFLL